MNAQGNSHILQVDIKYPDETKEKTRLFTFCPENKVRFQDEFSELLNEMKSKLRISCETQSCDWTDEKKRLIHYDLLKLEFEHGMTVDKFHDVISLKEKTCSKTSFNFNAN